MPPAAVDILPRHLQGPASTSSSNNPSPTGTPPVSSSPATSAPAPVHNQPRTPSSSNAPLPSPNLSNNPPGSPSTSSNRFGLNLGFIQRRQRGWTTSSAPRSPGGRGGGSPATSPASEHPPSPGGGERSGYGFPALRRTLSKRASSQGGEGSRTRTRRSSSQPPAPNGLDGGSAGSGGEGPSRPASGISASNVPAASGSGATQQPQAQPQMAGSSALTATTSLPNPPNRASTLPPSRSATGDTSAGASDASGSTTTHKLRLVPHLESSRSLHFDPIERDLASSAIVRIGRFTDRHGGSSNASQGTAQDPARVAFKSKVVSRGHAEIWVDDGGKFFIRDTKSSSGTFLNHIRLAGPNVESRPFSLKDGDVLQLGVDYQGGTEEIYRCVKMRVELNRGWQRGANNFNTAALAQLRALGASPMDPSPTGGSALTAAPSNSNATPTPSTTGGAAAPAKVAPPTAAQQAAQAASITDCCICLYPVTVCQALFIAPCSHVTHFKCIRPLVEQNYPGFCCPLCRTYANLEADVEIDLPEPEPTPLPADEDPSSSSLGLLGVSREPDMDAVEEVDEPASRAPSIRSPGGGAGPRPSGSRRSSVAALTQALGEASIQGQGRRGSSRPASIAPSAREREAAAAAEEDEEDDERDGPGEGEREDEIDTEEGTEEDGDAASQAAPPIPHLHPASPDQPSSSSFSSPLAIGGPSSSSSNHLSPPSDDLYASLASAATPPNNTFLSTLAESGLSALPGASFFARPAASGPPASGTAGMGSLDAAVLGGSTGPNAASSSAGAGPSRISVVTSTSATTNSGEGASDGDEEGSVSGSGGEGEGEGDDAETQEANSQEGGDAAPPSPSSPGSGGSASKGKGKERATADEQGQAKAASPSSSPSSAPPVKEAASPASTPAKGKKGKAPVDEHHTDPAIAAAALMI
ncbi:hypothetical protein JCM6882_007470 [Rhodosporidiobolus microsporus]